MLGRLPGQKIAMLPQVLDLAPAAPTPPLGTYGNDAIAGGSLDDRLFGRPGNDWIAGREGRDSLYGGPDQDSLYGNAGDDLLFGGTGNDLLVGDSFFDINDPDRIDGGTDRLYGGGGNDSLYGRLENDLLFGGFGEDLLVGGTLNDSLFGGWGNDRTRLSNGDDYLVGGAGDDTLTDGLGSDTFVGGGGADVFVYSIRDDIDRDEGGPTADYGVGDDVILDLHLDQRDRVELDLTMGYQVVVSAVIDNGTDTALVLSHGETLTLRNFSGQDFASGMRFTSVADLNALSQQLYGYEAVVLI